ncbi:MAG: RsmD family RNA methyltransferase, partial [Planctomycetaceae bacterium]|nr:RsmD family RNA methyltransferase [Planctomycetaceae bacterium]
MRIIAGSARRTELEVAAGSTTRPFLEMARGALFNSLLPMLPEARVLDVYAGSGALGLEALSRGAGSCVFVERDPRAASALTRNIAKCGFSAEATILRQDAYRAVAGFGDGAFDIVLFDP